MLTPFPSAVLHDLNSNEIDVKALAQKYQLIVITLKATRCSVWFVGTFFNMTIGRCCSCNQFHELCLL